MRCRGSFILRVHRNAKLQLGDDCRFNSGYQHNFVGGEQKMAIQMLPGSILNIGNRVAISNSTIVCGVSITLEDGVFIGGGCHIYDTDFHSLKAGERIDKINEEIRAIPIRLKRYSFIGAHSTILRGVEVGERSIVAAGSIVVKSIPDHELWGGAPAKFLRKLTPAEINDPVRSL